MKIKSIALFSILSIGVLFSILAHGQNNPEFYFRISQCLNSKATIFINDTQLHEGSCSQGLAWAPVYFNELLQAKNKLRIHISNERPDDFYGSLTFQLLVADTLKKAFKQFYSYQVTLQDYDKFQMSIDNLLKKQGWELGRLNPGERAKAMVTQANKKDSINYFFSKQDRYYLTITAAKQANYEIQLNQTRVLHGQLHISALQDAYALATYPFFFLNQLDMTKESVMMHYSLQPQPGKKEAYLEVIIQHFPPNASEGVTISTNKITCPANDIRNGQVDLTEPLRRHGFFNR